MGMGTELFNTIRNLSLESYIDYAEGLLLGTKEIPRRYLKYKKILAAIRWETPEQTFLPTKSRTHDQRILPTTSWTHSQRIQLITMFNELVHGNPHDHSFVPSNIISQSLADNVKPTTVLGREDAWRIFLSHVANSLFMEISGELNWSMKHYSADQLAMLLHSRSFFRWLDSYGGYWLDDETTGWITPTTAGFLLRFIKTNGPTGLIAASSAETIANVLEWCRHFLVHFVGGFEARNVEDTWEYRGYPPIVRMVKANRNNNTAGCWGTAGFIKAVLRIVNIPVEVVPIGWSGLHEGCYFVREANHLTHGDDVYSTLTYSTPPFPVKEVMIDQDTYDSWFDYPDVPEETCQNNISRQDVELALEYLPDYLLELYCEDQNQNRPQDAGAVWSLFENFFTYQQLLDFGLWTRMQSKVESFGGCQNIPHSYQPPLRLQIPWVP